MQTTARAWQWQGPRPCSLDTPHCKHKGVTAMCLLFAGGAAIIVLLGIC